MPYPCWRGVDPESSLEVELLLCGQGPVAAAAAVAGWLALRLSQSGRKAGSALELEPITVANFGTAACQEGAAPPGATFLVNRIARAASTFSEGGSPHYPERLLAWSGGEAECHTVQEPQRWAPPLGHGAPVRLYEMEAWGVAEAVAPSIGWAGLLVGKTVLDPLPARASPQPSDGALADLSPPDWRTARSAIESAYREGAHAFLELALAHHLLRRNLPRRQLSEEAAGWCSQTLVEIGERIHLTATQRRELARALRAWFAAPSRGPEGGIGDPRGEEALRAKKEQLIRAAQAAPIDHRHAQRRTVQQLHEHLTPAAVLSSVRREASAGAPPDRSPPESLP